MAIMLNPHMRNPRSHAGSLRQNPGTPAPTRKPRYTAHGAAFRTDDSTMSDRFDTGLPHVDGFRREGVRKMSGMDAQEPRPAQGRGPLLES